MKHLFHSFKRSLVVCYYLNCSYNMNIEWIKGNMYPHSYKTGSRICLWIFSTYECIPTRLIIPTIISFYFRLAACLGKVGIRVSFVSQVLQEKNKTKQRAKRWSQKTWKHVGIWKIGIKFIILKVGTKISFYES